MKMGFEECARKKMNIFWPCFNKSIQKRNMSTAYLVGFDIKLP